MRDLKIVFEISISEFVFQSRYDITAILEIQYGRSASDQNSV